MVIALPLAINLVIDVYQLEILDNFFYRQTITEVDARFCKLKHFLHIHVDVFDVLLRLGSAKCKVCCHQNHLVFN